jgi:hypothetical protein
LKRNFLNRAAGLLAVLATVPLYATVTIQSLGPNLPSPQPVGTSVIWSAKATDSQPNNLTFQFSITPPGGSLAMVKDFNIGTQSAGTWTSAPFVWDTIAGEGTYTIQVIAKDFVSGATATKTQTFVLGSRVLGGAPVVHSTGNALVALFSAPACPTGSTMRVAFYTGNATPTYTTAAACKPPTSMNFYVAGMLPSTTYSMYSQTITGGVPVNGTTLNFTTGPLPTKLPAGFLPSFTVNTPAPANDPNPMLLYAFTKIIVPVATDLNGHIMWYYGDGAGTLLTRPLYGGTMLTIQNGESWDSSNTTQQLLAEIDFAGTIVRETNTGVIANQLVAMGAKDATPCGQIVQPPVVGDACLNDFHHDAIRYEVGGLEYTAFMAHIEKLYPPGTQGNTGPNNVDVLSEMVIVLNSNWQVVWYYDAFNELDINRAAPLGEVCSAGTSDCPTDLFLSTVANDWTHANTVDYVAASAAENPDSGDFIVSMRDQDQLIRVHYNNGAGSCAPPPAASCIVWYMGPPDNLPVLPNSFTMDQKFSEDEWPWFSHQHDATYANSGTPVTLNNLSGITGPLLTIFDNGNTRYSAPPLGLGTNCSPAGEPNDCNSRGYALIVDETTMTVIPVMMQNLSVKTTALGAAGLLSNGNFFFQSGLPDTQAIELEPGTAVFGKQVMNIGSADYSYRGWQLPNLYEPPAL